MNAVRCWKMKKSWSISRVLSWMIIYLGATLLMHSSSLPESHNAAGRHCFLFGLASGGVYLAAVVTHTRR